MTNLMTIDLFWSNLNVALLPQCICIYHSLPRVARFARNPGLQMYRRYRDVVRGRESPREQCSFSLRENELFLSSPLSVLSVISVVKNPGDFI
jgi:hypothetical protein